MDAHQYTDNMELARTVSLLAAANQQLASAHNLALGRLEALCAVAASQQPVPWTRDEWAAEMMKTATTCNEGKREMAKMYCANCQAAVEGDDAKDKAKSSLERRRNIVRATKKRIKKKKFKIQETINHLRREIKNLSTFKLESQLAIERLTSDLGKQQSAMHRAMQDLEDSQRDCHQKNEARIEEALLRRLDTADLSRSRLQLAEPATFQARATTDDGTATQDDEDETDEVVELRARLTEGDVEGEKELRELAEAARRIRSLELIAEANQVAVDAIPLAEATAAATTDDGPIADATTDSSASKSGAASMGEFRRELLLKREARQRAIASISAEMERLRMELEGEKRARAVQAGLLEDARREVEAVKAAREARVVDAAPVAVMESKGKDIEATLESRTDVRSLEFVEALRLSDLLKMSDEITSDLWLQLERTDDLRFQLESSPDEHRLRIGSLKRLAEETRTSLRSRKEQINTLKDRLAQILVRLGDRAPRYEADDVRREIVRQTEDIGRARGLNDERMRILAELKDHCFKEIHEVRLKFESAKKDNAGLEEDLRKTEDKLNSQDAEILNLESQLGLAKADCRDLQNQMSVINSLFTQMLLSASSAEMDLDRLTRLLQENHDLISDMAKENGTEAAALPKLLLDIIKQVDGRARENEEKRAEEDLQEESIAHNLPKVWRVLLELLSCHAAEASGSNAAPLITESAPDSCYKSVDTPTGPRLVISVSKTYIRLKELILEKKSLEKEMNRMKQLNTHLESKLSEQEKRLSTVSDELSKTWNIVGRMQAQHQQLHTHEKILRYELQQKRKMLQELKQELEYCREKWESARQKNTNTEIEWRSLRKEFAARKALITHGDSFNTSGESGFSDEREEESDEDDEEEDVGKRIRPMNSRRRSRKDESRAKTPDTESEHPTDNEFSESKTVSTRTSEQRIPTPESEAELENSEVLVNDLLPTVATSDNLESEKEEILNPLDEALTNVIQNLIASDTCDFQEASKDSDCGHLSESNSLYSQVANEESTEKIESTNTITNSITDTGSPCVQENNNVEPSEHVNTPSFSVFSIGPFPSPIVPINNATPETEKFFSKASEISYEVDNTSMDSLSSLETVRECLSDHNENPVASSSTESTRLEADMETSESVDVAKTTEAEDSPSAEVLDARAARLRMLEEQAQWLVKRMSATNRRGSALSSRLAELHETYGSIPAAPPMPEVMPTFRLRCELNETEPTNEQNNNKTDITENKEEA